MQNIPDNFPDNVLSARMIVFDLDGTLAESKQAIDAEMAGLIHNLLMTHLIAVMSGGAYEQFDTQFISHLPANSHFENLSILPASGAIMYQYTENTWKKIYENILSPEEKTAIFSAFDYALREAGYEKPEKTYGDIIEDRDAQVTFSALGQQAPLALKEVWDPERTFRTKIVGLLQDKLGNEFQIGIGGSTSIDITKKGIDKAYGIRELSEKLHVSIPDMLFIGDALETGGNDSEVIPTGIKNIDVSGPEETKQIINMIISHEI